MNDEIWKPIKGFEGFYEVSDLGRVKSLDRWYFSPNGRHVHATERILKVFNDSKGYPSVVLSKDGKAKIYLLHRLIACHFIPNPERKSVIDHINTNPQDFRIDNLRWVTTKENCNNPTTKKHLSESLCKAQKQRLDTLVRNHAKTSPKKVLMCDKNGILIREFNSNAQASRYINGNSGGIFYAINKQKDHLYKGYKWYYEKIEPAQ